VRKSSPKSAVVRKTAPEKEVQMEEERGRNWRPIGIVALILAIVACILGAIFARNFFPTTAASPPPPIHTPYPTSAPATSKDVVSPIVVERTECLLDKVATIYEVESAERQRIEVGGHGIQHVDYYPDKGIKSISYIVPAITPPETPEIWWGFGSIWEGQLPECSSYNWVADTTKYAGDRLDSGHSGIVIDLRVDDPQKQVVANVAGLSETEVEALLAVHRQGMAGNLAVSEESIPAAVAVTGCPQAVAQTYATPADVSVTGPAIVHPWWNNGLPSFDQAQVRVLLRAGESATFLQMMGKTYIYADSAACKANLDDEFASADFPVKSIGELQSESLVR